MNLRPSTMTCQLKTVDQDAVAQLAQLHAHCFPRGWSESEFNSFFEQNNIIALIMYDGEKPVAFSFSWVVADQCELLAIGVLDAWRKQGLAGQMVAQTLRSAADKGAVQAFLEVGTNNVGALALYEAAGFERFGMRKGYYSLPDGTTQDAFTMRRNLG